MFEGLWSLLRIVVIVYVSVGLFLFLMQERSIFYPDLPTRELKATPADAGLSYESVWMVSEDGVRVHGWYLPAKAGKGVILFFHGNAGNISHRLASLKIFNDFSYSVLIIDYRGYGQSEGRISELGTYRDAEAAWRYLTEEKRFPAGDIILFGRSLGGSIAAYLARQKQPRGLIVESAFTSVDAFAAEIYPLYPVRYLLRYHYPTREYLRDTRCPVLIIHSQEDEIIPFHHGQQLFEAANQPRQWLPLRGGHNDGFMRSGMDYINGLGHFLNATHTGAPLTPEP